MSLCPSCNREAGEVAKFCPSCGAAIVRGPAGEDLVGRIVAGKYRVEALIGEGGMGKVYRAIQLSLEKTVVLKVLRASLLSDERTVARFQREAKAASRLNHPNSIGIIDFGQGDDGSLYIAMEHVAGRDLHQVLSREGPLAEPRMGHVVGQVLSALADAHAAGVIHRDLKPENIMVEQRRKDADFVKVLDFGIAKIQESDGSEGTALTRAGFVCGTPEYMSPEQARGAPLDARSDLYAVGVILYQCATGSLPFEADSAIALATMHLTKDPAPPRLKRPDLSQGMEELILRAMSKNPIDRPQTAEQFRAELLAIAGPMEESAARQGHAPGQPSSRPAQVQAAASSAGGRAQVSSDAALEVSSENGARPRSPLALALAVAVGTAALVGGGLAAYQASKRTGPRGAALQLDQELARSAALAQSTPATKGQAPQGPAGETRRRSGKVPELLRQGDAAIAAGKVDEALALYSRALEADSASGAAVKRLALANFMKSDAAASDRWIRAYLTLGENAPDAEYFERHLKGAR